jgi:3-phenylpropionate/cinnamic acid dioxygenase small subunit
LSQVKSLLRRISMTDVRGAIQNLIFTYADLLDKGDVQGVVDLFVDDAEVSVGPFLGAPTEIVGATFRGRDEIFSFHAHDGRRSPLAGRFLHITTNSIIDPDEEAGTASASSYYTVVGSDPNGAITVFTGGRYHDRFRRVAGEWRFVSRHHETTLVSKSMTELRQGSN